MKAYKAVFFDWDGTAVLSRRTDAADALAAMTAVLRRGVRLIIISGTTYENICGGQLERLIPPELLTGLSLGLARGNYNYGFDGSGCKKLLMDNTPELSRLTALHDATYALHRELLSEYGLPTDIVFTRPNYCKIDIMADTGRSPDALFLQADEVARVNDLLAEHRLENGLAGLLEFAEAIGRRFGLTLKATTDAKYLELGYTTKSDNVDRFMADFVNMGIGPEDCCFWGDEFGAISAGVWGSDQQMITSATAAGDFFSVADLQLPLPEEVQELGGGPVRFMEFLRTLAEVSG